MQIEPPLALQQSFWNDWNAQHRESERGEISRRQAEVVVGWLASRRNLRILEVGCGAGWFCQQLTQFGTVIGTDLADELLGRAQRRWPKVSFIAGDFLSIPFEPGSFDVVVSLETLSHVADQQGFIRKIHELLRPHGSLMLATQNRPVLQDHCIVPPAAPAQVRHWLDRAELAALVENWFEVQELFSITPIAHKGPRRLLTSSKVNAVLRPFLGNKLRDYLEARDWGWTLMLRAKKLG